MNKNKKFESNRPKVVSVTLNVTDDKALKEQVTQLAVSLLDMFQVVIANAKLRERERQTQDEYEACNKAVCEAAGAIVGVFGALGTYKGMYEVGNQLAKWLENDQACKTKTLDKVTMLAVLTVIENAYMHNAASDFEEVVDHFNSVNTAWNDHWDRLAALVATH